MPETVQALLELHGERNSCFVSDLEAGRHLDEHVVFDVGVEKYCLRVKHVHLIVPLRRACEHNTDTLKPGANNLVSRGD